MNRPTPRTVAQYLAGQRRRALDVEARIAEWNDQMVDVVAAIHRGAAHGRGLVITTSRRGNYIAAHTSDDVPVGTAAVFDLDTDNPRPTHRHLSTTRLPRRTA
jgi:uncharacterized protein YgbK (DUF1537 family)